MITTRNRVPANTDQRINGQIQDGIAQRVQFYDAHRQKIPARLIELDEEWDIERAIELNASIAALSGVALAITKGRLWFLLPTAVAVFLLQHAVQGWCPPVPVLRRLGFGTSFEIDQERQALKAIRGDYNKIAYALDKPEAAYAASR